MEGIQEGSARTVQGKRLYKLEMAKEIVAKRREAGVVRKTDIVDYQRDFMACANELIVAGVLSEGEMSQMFEEGLPSKLRSNLRLRLEFKFPNHQPDMLYTLDKLVSTLLYLADTGIPLGGEGSVSGSKTETVVKAEASKEAKLFVEAVKGFTMAVERLGNTRPPMGGMSPYSGPSLPQRAPPQQPPTGLQGYACNFCGNLDHFVRNCPVAEEYVRAGKCKRGEDGRLTLPNGMYLPWYITGQTMRERFDKYAVEYAKFIGDNRPADTLIWSVASLQYENAEVVDGFVGEKKKKREIMDTVEVPARKKEVSKMSAKEGQAKGKGTVPATTRSPDDAIPLASGPQYKYSTPIEDPKIAKGVLDRAMDVKIELSQREFLALSPEV